jgi:nicotinate-nucleotide pyrophosphorylase (carboxylating)
MATFTHAEAAACQALIALALREDLGELGDVTTLAFISAERRGRAAFVARSPGILAGLPAAALVLRAVDRGATFTALLDDGVTLKRGDRIAVVEGPTRSILTVERTALNFLQRLSGVATQTRKYVDVVAGLKTNLLDTRKTTPGWRLLEKYAVRAGGGLNHRTGLHDMILIKDNHLAALGGDVNPIGTAIRRAREQYPGLPVEVEVESLEQLDRALPFGPDMILLDNMQPEMMRECVRRRDAARSKALLEASGGVTLATLRTIAETGVDRVSVGALTHSAVALDIALDWEPLAA